MKQKIGNVMNITEARIAKNIQDKESKKLLDALPVGEVYGILKDFHK